MTDRTNRPGRIRLGHQQVRAAFGADPDRPAVPGTIAGVDGDEVEVRHVDGRVERVTVDDPDRLGDVLGRDDLCRLDGRPLVLTNVDLGVLGVATGPPTPPPRLEVLWVSSLEDGEVVELLSGGADQPAWQVLALR